MELDRALLAEFIITEAVDLVRDDLDLTEVDDRPAAFAFNHSHWLNPLPGVW